MSKSIYEEALEDLYYAIPVGYPKYLIGKTIQTKGLLDFIKQAEKQGKLLGHYKDLAEVRKELYELTTNFKQSNKDRMIVLFTQETLVSNIIKELENE